MNALESLAETAFAAGWRTAWQAAVLIVLVLCVTRVLRGRLSSRWTYALWCLVALRLAIPTSPQFSHAALDWDRATHRPAATMPTGAGALVPSGLAAPRAARETGAVISGAVPSGAMPSEAMPSGAMPSEAMLSEAMLSAARRASHSRDEDARDVTRTASGRATPGEFAGSFTQRPARRELAWTTWAFLVWALGALAKLCTVTLREQAFRRRLRAEPELETPWLRALLDESRADLGIAREVRLVRSELAGSPALSGWRRPTILLPARVTGLGRDELRGVLLHELAHAKHADVLANALFAWLGCVWWFHPFVGFAFGELRAAREALRDREALSTPRSPAPLSYAETLLTLSERRPTGGLLAASFFLETHETRRRIQMIADFRAPRASIPALGMTLVLGLSWLTFTSAAAAPRAPEPSLQARSDGIQVVRHHPEPAWRAELEAALDKTLSVEFDETYGDDVIDLLRRETGVNFIVQRDLFSDYGVESVTFTARDVRVRDVLALLCESVGGDVDFALTDRVVYLGVRGEIPLERDLRFYKVAELLDPASEGEAMDELMSLVVMLSAEDSWDEAGVMIESWNGLMLVTQTDEGHKSVKALLDRLLNGGQRGADANELRSAKNLERLRTTRTSVKIDEQPVGVVLAQLSELVGLPLRADEDDITGDFMSLELNDVSVLEILTWIARRHDAHVLPDAAGVRLGRGYVTGLEFYDLTTLYERADDPEEILDGLDNLIRSQIEPQLWDEDPGAYLLPWHQYLLVRTTASAHVEITQLIDALEQVTR